MPAADITRSASADNATAIAGGFTMSIAVVVFVGAFFAAHGQEKACTTIVELGRACGASRIASCHG